MWNQGGNPFISKQLRDDQLVGDVDTLLAVKPCRNGMEGNRQTGDHPLQVDHLLAAAGFADQENRGVADDHRFAPQPPRSFLLPEGCADAIQGGGVANQRVYYGRNRTRQECQGRDRLP